MTDIRQLAHSILERLRSGDANVEEKCLDIKKQWHHAQTSKPRDEIRDEFSKDICAMANSSYPSSGYLIFGLSTEPPHLFTSALPLDEASLQQQISGTVSPPPEVRFEQFELDGIRISAAIVTSSLARLPHVAKHKGNLWIPWVRQGSTTRAASHLDLTSLFDLRRGAEQTSRPRISIVGQVNWAGNWSAGAGRWSPHQGAPRAGQPVSGFNTIVQITNSGTLPTAFTALTLAILWKDGTTTASTSSYATGGWPLAAPERFGKEYSVTFLLPLTMPLRLDSVERLTIIGTDIENVQHSFDVDATLLSVQG